MTKEWPHMTEIELQAFTETLCDRLPNKMEMVSDGWSRRWDAYRAIIPAVVKALGLIVPEPTKEEKIAAIIRNWRNGGAGEDGPEETARLILKEIGGGRE